MSFGNPLMLWGMLAALIPLLVHLFDRRRPRPHPFGAISFVLKSQKRTASRLKLKRLILYTLRTLIFLLIPLALAKPEWRQSAAAAPLARGPAATGIVVDASLSMRYQANGTLFDKACDEARDAIKDLLPEEPATVLLCGPNPEPPGAPVFDRGRLRQLIDDAQPTFAASDMTRCIELAAKALEESPLAGKRLVVISDLTANAFRLEVPPPTLKGPNGEEVRPEVVLRDAAGVDALPNRAVVDLRLEPATQAGPRAYVVVATVRNFSADAVKNLEVSMKVGDRVVAKGFIDVAADGTAQKTFTYRFESGGTFAGEVVLAADALVDDDRRSFVVTVPKELKALVVNGAPHSTRYRDEAFFVDAALDAPGSPVRQTLRDLDSGLREPFENYDLVYLLNVPAPSREDAARLAQFVDNGGGLFVSMGDQVDPDAYNKALGPLLPRPLRLVKTSANREEADAERLATKLGEVDEEHALFSLFTGRAREGLMGARFYRYMLLEAAAGGQAAGAAQVLAKYEDGAPAIAVAKRGKGRVMLFTSTVDRDWSDFAIRTSFLPLLQRFSAYLTGSLEERDVVRARVGELVTLRPSGELRVTGVKAPSGADVAIKPNEDGSVSAGPVLEPGAFTVLDAGGKPTPSLAFTVVLDPAESDLTRLQQDQLAGHFGEEAVRASSADGEKPAVPLWTWLLLGAVAAFFLEGVLLRK